jgi:hypothetical protein
LDLRIRLPRRAGHPRSQAQQTSPTLEPCFRWITWAQGLDDSTSMLRDGSEDPTKREC